MRLFTIVFALALSPFAFASEPDASGNTASAVPLMGKAEVVECLGYMETASRGAYMASVDMPQAGYRNALIKAKVCLELVGEGALPPKQKFGFIEVAELYGAALRSPSMIAMTQFQIAAMEYTSELP